MKGVFKEEEWQGDELTAYELYDDMVKLRIDFERAEVLVSKKFNDGEGWDDPMELKQPRRDLFRMWREQLQMRILRRRMFVKKNILEIKKLKELGVPLDEAVEEVIEREESRELKNDGMIQCENNPEHKYDKIHEKAYGGCPYCYNLRCQMANLGNMYQQQQAEFKKDAEEYEKEKIVLDNGSTIELSDSNEVSGMDEHLGITEKDDVIDIDITDEGDIVPAGVVDLIKGDGLMKAIVVKDIDDCQDIKDIKEAEKMLPKIEIEDEDIVTF